MPAILEPETPGGLRLSIACRLASSSATADILLTLLSSISLARPLQPQWYGEFFHKGDCP
jgi:hypothetical protein